MKKLILLNILFCLAITLSAQSLLDIYQKGTVKLIPDETYAQNNDWEEIFTVEPRSIVVRSDGQLVVNYPSKNYYSLFDQKGKFIKQFGVTNKSGKHFQNIGSIAAITKNNYITQADNVGNIYFADFEGKYQNSLKVKYLTNDIIPLNDDLIAVSASVLLDNRFKEMVAIINCNTNEEKIIWESLGSTIGMISIDKSLLSAEAVKVKLSVKIDANNMNGLFISTLKPDYKYHPFIFFINNQLTIVDSKEGTIMLYDINGKLLLKEKIEDEQKFVSVEEQRELVRKIIEGYTIDINPDEDIPNKEVKAIRDQFIKNVDEELDKIKEPIKIPAFATVIKDSDNNLLFFEMPEESGDNKFNVWIFKDGGKFVCQSSFTCDDYDLSIMPSKMVFHNGYIYSLQSPKNSKDNSLRLVRFKLTN